PCHVAVDPANRFVVAANYTSGSIAVLPIRPDGRLARFSGCIHHRGRGPHPKRQEGAHSHAVVFSPDGRYLYAVDLGVDRIFAYRCGGQNGRLVPDKSAAIALPAGSGPRSLVFHPNGRLAFCINELSSTVAVLRFDAADASLSLAQIVSTLPADFIGPNSAADIRVSACGGFVLASNRGHDSLAVFQLLPDDRLHLLQIVACGGRTPRNFVPTPAKGFFLVANQDSDEIAVFHQDRPSGLLRDTGSRCAVPSPVCLTWR
ncbi:lactonase family protein, partial [candidate division KSB1 bacterium]|nr:lactonase family protein [candidate division KSB1 bacterium]